MKIIANAIPDMVCEALAGLIGSKLEKNEPVLLLCSGSGNGRIAVGICENLLETFKGREERLRWLLTVSLADERFGPENSQDSTWTNLVFLGLPVNKIGTIPILRGTDTGDEAFKDAIRRHDAFLAEAVERKQNGNLYIAALLGIGADDHTAGILPGSPLMNPETKGRHDCLAYRYAAGYRSSLFTRITVTPDFFPFIDHASVWIDAKENPDAVSRLEENLSPAEHPAQLLKNAGETVMYLG